MKEKNTGSRSLNSRTSAPASPRRRGGRIFTSAAAFDYAGIPDQAVEALVEFMDDHLQVRGDEPGPLFLTINRRRTGFTEHRLQREEAFAMVKRRTNKTGKSPFCNCTFLSDGVTAYISNEGQLDKAQQVAAHARLADDQAL